MRRSFTYSISNREMNQTVEQLLLSRGYSRHLIIDLKKSPEYLTIGGEHVYISHRMAEGEILQVLLPEEISSEKIVPTPMSLDIVYEDEDLMVINKTADTPIHPSQGNFENTLANGVAWHYKQLGEPFTYRVINRLDRDTTGLLILAKHALSACILSEMIQRREIHRTYLAAVSGKLSPVAAESADDVTENHWQTISAPIARVDGSTIERCVDYDRGETAITHYRLLSYSPTLDVSLLELKLETGRTHQIRVHMKHLGHPLFGDFLYNPDYRYIKRQSLHSWKLSFLHPITKEPLSFTAAVPDDMKLFTKSEVPLDNDF